MDIFDLVKTGSVVKGVASSHGGNNMYSLSIVYNRNGKRVKPSKALYSSLGKPATLQFLEVVAEKKLYIAKKFDDSATSYKIIDKDDPIIYSGPLTKELIEAFDLDYSTRTSCSFPAEMQTMDDGTGKEVNVAVVDRPLNINFFNGV